MSTEYYCYTEINRDGQWHALNGMYYNEEEGKYRLAETYYSGSRSYFSKTYQKLKELGTSINSHNLSKEVLEEEDWINPEDTDCRIVAVALNDLRNAVPKTNRKQFCGYVHKRDLWALEVEGDEIEDYLTSEEYNALSDAEKREYEFYEWDDPMGWVRHIKEIVNIVNVQLKAYADVNDMWNEPTDVRLVCIEA